MKLIIANRNYSSWSLRGWLAARQSGLTFEVDLVPLDLDHKSHRAAAQLAPSGGKVPILWDGDTVAWDSLAILDYLADKVGRDRFWPKPDDARALARSMVAEMHSGFPALREECTMNIRRVPAPVSLSAAAKDDINRVLTLWAEARARFGHGGPFLFGSFCAADIAFAPVVTRFRSYAVPVPPFAETYMQAVWEHTWMQEWAADATAEKWVIAGYER